MTSPQLHRSRVSLTCLILLIFTLPAMTASGATGDRHAAPEPNTPRPPALADTYDLQGPFGRGPSIAIPDFVPANVRTADRFDKTSAQTRYDDIGGDDQPALGDYWTRRLSMDIGTSGEFWVAGEGGESGDPRAIDVHGSTSGGNGWAVRGRFIDFEGGHFYDPCLIIANGIEDRVYVAYRYVDDAGQQGIYVAWNASTGLNDDWSHVLVMTNGTAELGQPRLVSDAEAFDDYYLYLVFAGERAAGGSDVWFCRSTDQGASWETPYAIGQMSVAGRRYWKPDLSYGYGGYIHVVWGYEFDDQSSDSALRYRRADGYASSGASAWDSIQYLGSTTDGAWDATNRVAASASSVDVLIARKRMEWLGGISWGALDADILISDDRGADFDDPVVLANGLVFPDELQHNPGTDQWIVSGLNGAHSPALQRADKATPEIWSGVLEWVDDYATMGICRVGHLAIDPTRDHGLACMWIDPDDATQVYIDAEWFSGPGYPEFELGFPLALDVPPESPPAVVDLDDDGDLEIVWGDILGRIHAVHHDGQAVDGWPVVVGQFLSDGPVAIGRLQRNDELTIVAGTREGRIYCYDVAGRRLDGWPVDLGTDAPAYVSIGALNSAFPRTIVACSGPILDYFTWQGQRPPHAIDRDLGRTFVAPCAIGDVDGDGVNEIVGAADNLAFALKIDVLPLVYTKYLSSFVSDAVTLGDLDLDGDVEALVPTIDGVLYALDDNGSDLAGSWPFTTHRPSPMTSAAIAQCRGTVEPEALVAIEQWHIHMLYPNGDQDPDWPVETDWFYLTAAPVVGRIDGTSSDVTIGTAGTPFAYLQAWNNFGELIEGWPKYIDDVVRLSPAMGDLDQDGSNEIVYLGDENLYIVDVHNAPNDPSRTWPMYAHDPRRSGCADCPEDLVTPVPDEQGGAVRLSFAAMNPVPRCGPAILRFELPERAAVNLEIIDLRGRRLCTVLKEERAAGRHAVEWPGRDRQGRRLAAGQYFARLEVRGPTLHETLVRKMALLH